MTILTATISSYTDVLRNVYTPKLWLLQNRDRILSHLIARDTLAYAEGTGIKVRLHTAGSGGVGWSSTGDLPEPGVQAFDDVTANYKRIYGRFRIDGALIKASRAPYAAEMKALEFEATHMIEDLADALAYDIWHTGTGALASSLAVHGTPADGEFIVPKAGNGIKVGQIIDVLDSAGTVQESGGTDWLVTSVIEYSTDTTKLAIVTDGTPVTDNLYDDTTYLPYRQGSKGAAIDGLDKIVSASGTYLGLNRSTASLAFWKAQELANGGTNREVTLNLLQQAVDQVEQNSPGTTKVMITTHAIWRKLADILVPDKRYEGGSMKLPSWCKALWFRDDIAIVRDKFAIPNRIYGLDTDTFKLYQDSEGGFIDEDGQILRLVPDKDQFQASWRRYLQLVCHDPASNFVIKDIAE